MIELKKVVMIAQVSATGASGKSPLLPPSGNSWDSQTGTVIWKTALDDWETKETPNWGKPYGLEEGIKV